MAGTYFFPRLLIAFAVPMVLASLGPAESHPELGSDLGPAKRKQDIEVYRASDVQSQTALIEMQKAREVVSLQAFRRGRKVLLRRKREDMS